MGLLDSLGSYVNDRNEEFYEIREKYDRYDDERLKREFKRASGRKKLIIASLLKERGY